MSDAEPLCALSLDGANSSKQSKRQRPPIPTWSDHAYCVVKCRNCGSDTIRRTDGLYTADDQIYGGVCDHAYLVVKKEEVVKKVEAEEKVQHEGQDMRAEKSERILCPLPMLKTTLASSASGRGSGADVEDDDREHGDLRGEAKGDPSTDLVAPRIRYTPEGDTVGLGAVPDSIDPWIAVLGLGYDDDTMISIMSGSTRRSRSRSRSRSGPLLRSFRQILVDTPEDNVDTEFQEIYHEDLPPTVSDLYIRRQKCGGLPIIFKHLDACVSETLTQTVDSLPNGVDFYVGATVDPRSRWLGRIATDERSEMGGHHLRWSGMILIAYTAEGRRIEKAAIKFAKTRYKERCTNKAEDPRGQAAGRNNWIYICA